MSAPKEPSLRVIIADDHAPTREDVRRALDGDARFEVCAEASDAAAAVQAALREKPDVCLICACLAEVSPQYGKLRPGSLT